jgi:hypothetical protein
MGYRGKVEEQNRARDLRAQAWTLNEIAEEVGASKSSVSEWVRDVPFDEAARHKRELGRKASGTAIARQRGPNALQRRKRDEIEQLQRWGADAVGQMTDGELLVAGAALYAGEGAKRDGAVKFANTDPRMVRLFMMWLRRFFEIDEKRLRVRLYLHEGLDLLAATEVWADVTGVPPSQFGKAYRAIPDPAIKKAKHIYGCASVGYSCSRTHRAVMGLVDALLSSEALPG